MTARIKKTKSLIHVNQHVLRANLKAAVDAPMLTCKQGSRSNTYAHEVSIAGPSRFVNSMAKPLSCGARVWVATEAEVSFQSYGADDLRAPAAGATVIRVNPKAIRSNLKNGTRLPVLTCTKDGAIVEAHEVIIHGPAKVRTANMSRAHEASIWVETMADVEIVALPNESLGASVPACSR